MNIEESKPVVLRLSPLDDRIHFSNEAGVQPNFRLLEKYIDFMSERERVKVITLTYKSKIESFWFVKYFPNLENICVESNSLSSLGGIENWNNPKLLALLNGPRPKTLLDGLHHRVALRGLSIEKPKEWELQSVRLCNSIETLCLTGWKNHALTGLKESLNRLSLIGGSIVCAGGVKIHKVEFAGCKKLKKFEECEVCDLTLDTTNAIGLMSLKSVLGLRRLTLTNLRTVSLEFLAHCKGIEELNLITKVPEEQLQHLGVLRNLKKCKIVTRDKGDVLIRSLSTKYPTVLFSPGSSVCFLNGSAVQHEKW